MSSPKPIFLKPGMTIILEGREVSFEELKDHVITSVLYRKHLKELASQE